VVTYPSLLVILSELTLDFYRHALWDLQVSFNNGEGWIIGKPPIMLHTAVRPMP
jgi:photosystem II stability/assembly factor-like uncharacterized protein